MNDAELSLRCGGASSNAEEVRNEPDHNRGPGIAANVARVPTTHLLAWVAPGDQHDVGAGHHWTRAISPAMYSISSRLKLGPEGR